jgi:RNA polymerase sigma-70 factor, ECF subfamily
MPPPLRDGSRPTSSAWLDSLRQRDASAWRRLTESYGPLLYAWCRRFGLPAQDAADVLQDVFRTLAARLDQFEHRGPGSFRAWLRAVTRSRVLDHFRRRDPQPHGSGLDEIALADDPSDDDSDRALFLRAVLDRVRPEFADHTWQAFWRLTVEGHASADIARDLGTTPEAVRQSKARVLRRLRSELEE